MKPLVLTVLVYFLHFLSYSQSSEFKTYPSGLMYSDTTMNQLSFIVDSLGVKFRTCELDRDYYSQLQAKGHYVRLSKGDVLQAKSDMESGISFEDLLKKHPKIAVEKDLLILKYRYTDYNDQDIVKFSSSVTEREISIKNDSSFFFKPLKGKWAFSYWPKDKYSEETIRAFYFTEEFDKTKIPEKYARLIQYSDCLIDTSTQIFLETATRGGVRYADQSGNKVSKFMKFINEQTKAPDRDSFDEDKYKEYLDAYTIWDSLKWATLDSLSIHDKKFNKLLTDAVKDALKNGGTTDEFELYVEKYNSPENALKMKRNRIVVGGCSRDNSPRYHAMNIAKLSAKTVNWETFLRAHLDIMNDRFQRSSDGSYAWGARKTYLKELEELNIEAIDLLLGISLRIDNPSTNHYYGSIRRIGRALSDSKDTILVEQRMTEMILDNNLDDYNRILIVYLYANYAYNFEDETLQKEKLKALKTAIKELPDYLASEMEFK
jgi:hypothetical protein